MTIKQIYKVCFDETYLPILNPFKVEAFGDLLATWPFLCHEMFYLLGPGFPEFHNFYLESIKLLPLSDQKVLILPHSIVKCLNVK